MKMRKSILELLEKLENERGEERRDASETAEYRLGAAMLERLGIPENIDKNEAVESLLLHWNDIEDSDADDAEPRMQYAPAADRTDAEREYLPRPIAGRLGEAPETDYESMSAEQFRRLRRQLKRAASDGRRVRL